MCTHKIDIPRDAIVEIVLVDEGEPHHQFTFIQIFSHITLFIMFNSLGKHRKLYKQFNSQTLVIHSTCTDMVSMLWVLVVRLTQM